MCSVVCVFGVNLSARVGYFELCVLCSMCFGMVVESMGVFFHSSRTHSVPGWIVGFCASMLCVRLKESRVFLLSGRYVRGPGRFSEASGALVRVEVSRAGMRRRSRCAARNPRG